MSIEFECPECEAVLRTADEKAGTSANCPYCSERIHIPIQDESRFREESWSQVAQESLPEPDPSEKTATPTRRQIVKAGLCVICREAPAGNDRRCRECRFEQDAIAEPDEVDLSQILSETWTVFTRNFATCLAVTVIDVLFTLVAVVIAFFVAVACAVVAGQEPAIMLLVFFFVSFLGVSISWSFLAIGNIRFYIDLCRHDDADIQKTFAVHGPAWSILVAGFFYWATAILFLPLAFLWPFGRVIVDQNRSGVGSLIHSLRMTTRHSGVCLALAMIKIGGFFAANLIPVFGQLVFVPYCATLNTVAYLHFRGENLDSRSAYR